MLTYAKEHKEEMTSSPHNQYENYDIKEGRIWKYIWKHMHILQEYTQRERESTHAMYKHKGI